MNIKRFFIVTATFSLALLSFPACSDSESADSNTEQQESIENFLEASHSPTLIPESEIGNALEENPPFYTEFGDFAYRYILDYYNAEREDKQIIQSGDSINIEFAIFQFTGSAIATSAIPIYTNQDEYADRLLDAGLNTEYWSFEPQAIILNSSQAVPAIFDGLVGAKVGDSVELYTTLNMAYGDIPLGTLEKNSALAIFVNILSIN